VAVICEPGLIQSVVDARQIHEVKSQKVAVLMQQEVSLVF
jgi:hypothetical protein